MVKENGVRFTDFCLSHGLVIGRSIFSHKEILKTTWISPDGATCNQIDHICITKNFRRSLLDVRAFCGTDANSDQEMLQAHSVQEQVQH